MSGLVGSPPPMTPAHFRQFFTYDPQNFFGKTRAPFLICGHKIFGRFFRRPKLQALEKKVAKKRTFRFTPLILADNGRNILKNILIVFSAPLDVDWSKFYEKN